MADDTVTTTVERRSAGSDDRTQGLQGVGRGPAFRRFGYAALLLVLGFGLPLFELVRFSVGSELYSHIPLIPFVSLYLIWPMRGSLFGGVRNGPVSNSATSSEQGPPLTRPSATLSPGERASLSESRPAPLLAAVVFVLSMGVLAFYWLRVRGGWKPPIEDHLAVMTLGFLLCLWSAGFAFLGGAVMRAVAFPAAFLVFMVPFPTFVLNGIAGFLQHGSADAAHGMLVLSGMPVFRVETYFKLPGFALEVAPQCSGIHSTLVLFITSVVGGHMFLRSPWRRLALAGAVIPLAILRNGFRIWTLGMLCVHVSPDMIDSPIHHQGGPIFFALSLIPFFLLLIWLRKSEARRGG